MDYHLVISWHINNSGTRQAVPSPQSSQGAGIIAVWAAAWFNCCRSWLRIPASPTYWRGYIEERRRNGGAEEKDGRRNGFLGPITTICMRLICTLKPNEITTAILSPLNHPPSFVSSPLNLFGNDLIMKLKEMNRVTKEHGLCEILSEATLPCKPLRALCTFF